MPRFLERGVVAIRGVDNAIKGTAFSILPRGYFVTCAHVVLDALQLGRDSTHIPSGSIHLVRRPLEPPIETEIVAWAPATSDDVAVLRAISELSDDVVSAPLHDVGLVAGLAFQSYGSPRNYHSTKYFGRLTRGDILGTIQSGPIQVHAADVTYGFSGAPIVDLQMSRIVGMLSAKDTPNAYAVPASRIQQVGRQFGVDVECLRPARPYHLLTAGLEGLGDDLLSRYESLLDYYLGGAAEPVPFGGRSREMEELDEWLADDTQRCGLIVQPAGRGKTALLVKWAAGIASTGAAEVVFVPVSNRFGTAFARSVRPYLVC